MFINISYYILYITSTSKQLSSPSGTPHDAHGALRVAGEGFRRQASKQSGPGPSTSGYLSRSLSTNLVYIYYLSIYIHRYITYYIRYGILRMVKISRYPSGRCFLVLLHFLCGQTIEFGETIGHTARIVYIAL